MPQFFIKDNINNMDSKGGRYHNSGVKEKMAAGNIKVNIAEREVYRGCIAIENLYGGFPI